MLDIYLSATSIITSILSGQAYAPVIILITAITIVIRYFNSSRLCRFMRTDTTLTLTAARLIKTRKINAKKKITPLVSLCVLENEVAQSSDILHPKSTLNKPEAKIQKHNN